MTTAAHAEHAHDHHHEHRLRPDQWPAEEFYGTASAGKVGMWVFLLSDALMFAGFLLAYGILRGGKEVWHCTAEKVAEGLCSVPQPALGINFTAILTFILICSSVSMVLALDACKHNDQKGTVKWLTFTILGGALFLCGQMQEYFGVFFGHGLVQEGLLFGDSAYATTFYLITSFHGAHVFSGVTYLTIVMLLARKGKWQNGYWSPVELVGLFWHFVDLIWILVFTLVYLIPE
jgi:heme/copper-type cytochrome/quinol oxidase subunit 3